MALKIKIDKDIFRRLKEQEDIIPVLAFPNTFRRKLIDFAVKIASWARYFIINGIKTIYKTIIIESFRKI
jgi:hypothetical protein